ncbi:MAG: DUF2975 domain-containing protein [Eubacteriaceae bacterium]|nr:DUF2975 domain-containing protein [Eubacteriaceae bacterium]
MEKKKGSVTVSLVLCAVIFAAVTYTLVRFGTIFDAYYAHYRPAAADSGYLDWLRKVLTGCLYPCCALAYGALCCLVRLLVNIRRDDIFTSENITYLKILSALCLAVSAVTLFGAVSYIPLGIISAAAFFIAVILWVIKDVFVNAKRIRDENELTI